jgi:DNA transformation protein
MPNRNSYLEFLLEQLAPLGEITTRGMFGGHTLYCDGVVFALVADNALYLKADDHNRPGFASRGLGAFRPFKDQAGVMQYYQAPPEMFEDPDALRHWGGGAVAAGQRAVAKKKARVKR